MPTGLITLPLRLGIRGASLALGVTERVAGLAWEVVEQFVPGHGGGDSHEPDRPFPRDAEPADEDGGASTSTESQPDDVVRDPRAEFELADRRVPNREPPPEPEIRAEEPPPAPPEPLLGGHVDTEETFVESFAEPGAEDGAGAQVRIEPPWTEYDHQTADEIIEQLDESPAAVLAAIELYEATHKRRSTVLSAVERQLKALAASADN